MKRILRVVAAVLIPLTPCVPAFAAPNWVDISGLYTCKGHDEHLGAFEDTHELRLDPNHHAGNSRGYRLVGYAEGKVAYTGEAITSGGQIAISYTSSTDKTDHGVLSGRVDYGNPVRFNGEYFESQYAGGDSGTAACTRTGQ